MQLSDLHQVLHFPSCSSKDLKSHIHLSASVSLTSSAVNTEVISCRDMHNFDILSLHLKQVGGFYADLMAAALKYAETNVLQTDRSVDELGIKIDCLDIQC